MEEENSTLHNMEIGKEFLEQIQEKEIANRYWKQFLQTGKVQDYLSYAQYLKNE